MDPPSECRWGSGNYPPSLLLLVEQKRRKRKPKKYGKNLILLKLGLNWSPCKSLERERRSPLEICLILKRTPDFNPINGHCRRKILYAEVERTAAACSELVSNQIIRPDTYSRIFREDTKRINSEPITIKMWLKNKIAQKCQIEG